MKTTLSNQEQEAKSLIQQNQISRGKVIIQVIATALVLIAAILPFANNIIGNFVDTKSIVFDNISGVRSLDLDSVLFFLSMPLTIVFLVIGGLFKAHKFSFYTVLISCYFQFSFLIRFILLDKNEILIIAEIAVFVIFLMITFCIYKLEKHYRSIIIIDKFTNTSLDRFSSILYRNNQIDEKD
ncbi:MAG: hypothetical protein ABI554_14270 [Flavobacterium sp.]